MAEGQDEKTPAQRHVAMSWAQRLKRVFDIDVETCRVCGGAAKVAVPAHPCAHGIRASLHIIAGIEDPVVIKTIVANLKKKAPMDSGVQVPGSGAPPRAHLFS